MAQRRSDEPLFAAVDLGSNSFRLEIARREAGRIVRVDYRKETVRLGAGLDESSALTFTAMQRGWDCLARFGERLRGHEPGRVRAVATQTLREAHNRAEFIAGAQARLGYPIDVIAGEEEARLIYVGVTHFLPRIGEARLVFDIGGRSTELITGHGSEADRMKSSPLGCVGLSLRCFADGILSAERFAQASAAAQLALREATAPLTGGPWPGVYGASGTVRAVSDVLRAEGWSDGTITYPLLDRLRERLIEAGHVDRVVLAGLKDDRRPVIGGGLAILCALAEALALRSITPAKGALRHGLLCELMAVPSDAPAGSRD